MKIDQGIGGPKYRGQAHAPQAQLQYVVRFAVATAGMALIGTKPGLAEFQIQEASIEKGEVELEYRGAYHWGIPEVTDANENSNDLVQSHEVELSQVAPKRRTPVRLRWNSR